MGYLITTIKTLVILVIALFLMSFRVIVREAHKEVLHFNEFNRDYSRIIPFGFDMTFHVCEAACAYIPANANVRITCKNTTQAYLKRYLLAPRNICYIDDMEYNWDYLLDVRGDYPYWEEISPSKLTSVELPHRIFLYSKKPRLFKDSTRPGATFGSSSRALPAFLWMQVLYLLTGIGTFGVLRIGRSDGSFLWLVTTAYLVGVFILTLIFWLLMLSGIFLTPVIILTLSIGLPSILILLKLKSWKTILVFAFSTPRRRQCEHNSSLSHPLNLLLLVCTCLAISGLLLCTILEREWTWDACSHWIYKAKLLFYDHFLPSEKTHLNDYPILWPLCVATQFILTGQCFDPIARWMAGLFTVVVIIQIGEGLSKLGLSMHLRFLFTLIYIGCFMTPSISMLTGYADAMAMAYYTSVIVCLLTWISYEGKRNCLILFFLLSLALSLTKSEGKVFCIMIILCAPFLHPEGLLSKEMFLAFFLIAIATSLAIGWTLWVSGYDVDTSGRFHFAEPVTLHKMWVLVCVLLESVEGRGLGYRLFAGFGLFAVCKMGSHPKRQTVFFALLSTAMIVAAGMSISGWSERAIIDSSLTATGRIIFYATVPMLLAVATLGPQRNNNVED